MKASSSWRGRKITLKTTEYYKDERQIVYDDFRAYDSLKESIEDHNKLLSYNRYKPIGNCKNYKEASEKIYECGYATDPKYPDKLVKIIEDNKLYELDSLKVITKNNKIGKLQELWNKLNIKVSEGKSLVVDNILGWRTRSCISKMPVLKLGSKGAAVEFVQELVDAFPIDGSFGPVTEKCVIAYQKDRKLKSDGIVGIEIGTSLITN